MAASGLAGTEQRPVLEVKGLEKAYSGRRVVSIDHLVLNEGDRLLLTGDNGSGKSTLLRVLAGILPVDKGTVHTAADLGKEHLGYVPQSGGLYPHLTFKEHLVLRGLLKHAFVHPSGAAFIDELGLGPFLDRPYGELSGGYRRLAALALALQGDVTWLLMDEPFSGLDAIKSGLVTRVLSEVASRLRLLVIVAPIATELPFVNRQFVLEGGTIR